jgi:glucose-1-phosphatase
MKALLFDLGNVLVSFDHRRAARALAPFTAKTPDEIYRLFFDSDLTGQFEEGKIAPVDFFRKVRDSLGARIVFDAFVPIWNDIFFMTRENYSLYEFICALGKKHTVALLSNINVLHFEYLRARFPVFEPFDRLFLSYQMDARKPDPLLYRTVLAALGTRPQDCFYTDDREDLVLAARGLGIRAFVYRGIDQLTSDLRDAGIEDH